MKKKVILSGVIIFLNIIILLNLVLANFTLANQSGYIENSTSYGKNQKIKGWINISLTRESENTPLTGFNSSIKIKDLLDSHAISYTCNPADCGRSGKTYSTIGSELSSKRVRINEGYSKVFGIKITEPIDTVTGLAFNLSSDGENSCVSPIKLDILDDNSFEWKLMEISNDSCYVANPYGCYRDLGTNIRSMPIVPGNSYCNKVKMPPVAGFRIGAKINGSSESGVGFKLSVNGKECEIMVSNAERVFKEINCTIRLDEPLDVFQDVDVCISVDNSGYAINYETNATCGTATGGVTANYDFEMYAVPLKYGNMQSNFRFGQRTEDETADIASKVSDYVSRKYNGNCTPECIIPIAIYSGINQNITLNTLIINYTSNVIPRSKTTFYETNISGIFITSKFSKLNLENANIFTPSEVGEKELILKLGNSEILKTNISVRSLPEIVDILPHNPPALVPVTYFALVKDGSANMTYSWNFGNATTLTSSNNLIKYTIDSEQSMDLTLKVSNAYGTVSKTVRIRSIPPVKAINDTIKEYRDAINNFSSKLTPEIISEFARNQINGDSKVINTEDLRKEIATIESSYKTTLSSDNEAYLALMKKLLQMQIPSDLEVSKIIKPSKFPQDKEQINFDVLTEFDIGEIDSGTEEDYRKAINNWVYANLNPMVEAKTYKIYYYSGEEDTLFTDVKLTLQNSEEDALEEIYLIINGDANKIKLNGGEFDEKTSASEDVVRVKFKEITGTQTIEFIYPAKTEATVLPFYITPSLDKLEIGPSSVGTCNNNKKCDEGETYSNCPNDCRPWTWVLILLIILIVLAFIVYIGMQEWYKRYYEGYLFDNKSQLFNLINYMHNASNQGHAKPDVFKKLKEYGWNNEQLDFAWKKFKGERLLFWEIPIFKKFENKKVQEEIEKRGGKPQNQIPVKKPEKSGK